MLSTLISTVMMLVSAMETAVVSVGTVWPACNPTDRTVPVMGETALYLARDSWAFFRFA